MPPKRRHWYTPTAVIDEERSGPAFLQGYKGINGLPSKVEVGLRLLPLSQHRWGVWDIGAVVTRVAVAGLCWASAWLIADAAGHGDLAAFGSGGAIFDTVSTITLCSVVGGVFAAVFQVSAIPFVLIAGLVYGNIGPEALYLTRGIPGNARKFSSLFAVAIIVVRAGLSLDLRQLARTWKPVLCLSLLPMAAEGLVHAAVASTTFAAEFEAAAEAGLGTPLGWAMLQGFIVSPIAPGVVLPGYLSLKSAGYGTADAGLSALDLVISAVVLDAVAALCTAHFCAKLVIGEGSIAIDAVLGPGQLIIGAGIGVLCGLLIRLLVASLLAEVGLGKVTNQPNEEDPPSKAAAFGQSIVLVIAAAISLVNAGDMVGYPGGATITVGIMASALVTSWAVVESAVAMVPTVHTQEIRETDAPVEAPDAANMDDVPRQVSSSSLSSPTEHASMAADTSNLVESSIPTSRPPMLTAEGAEAESAASTPPPSPRPAIAEGAAAHNGLVAAVHSLKLRVLTMNAWAWDAIALPFMFALTGASFNLAELFDGPFLSKFLPAFVAGISARVLVALGVAYVGLEKTNRGWREVVFVGVSWAGKGAVQVALLQLGVEAVNAATHAYSEGNPRDEALRAANTVRRAAAMTALIGAPFGSLFVSLVGPMLLRPPPRGAAEA